MNYFVSEETFILNHFFPYDKEPDNGETFELH